MTNKQINLTFATVIGLAAAGFGVYRYSLMYPRNSLAVQFDRCELMAGWKFRLNDFARTLCGLDAMDELADWAKD